MSHSVTAVLDPVANGVLLNPGASTVVLAGNTEGSVDQAWTVVDDGINNFNDETIDVATGNYIKIGNSVGTAWSFKLNTLASVGANSPLSIVSIKFSAVLRRANTGTGARGDLIVRNNRLNLTSGILVDTSALTTSYVLFETAALTTDPITGAVWSLLDLADQAIELGIRRHDPNGGNSFLHCTSCYITVVYNPDDWIATAPGTDDWAVSGAGSGGWGALGPGSGTWTTT